MMSHQKTLLLKLSLIGLVALTSASCALLGPDYQRPESELPTAYREVDSTANLEVPDDWWKLYQDPVLNDLVDKGLRNNTDIKLAVARIEEADAYLKEVGAALFPTIDFDTSATRSRITGLGPLPLFPGLLQTREVYTVGLSTSFEIDFWGKLRRAKESARAQAFATRYGKDTVALSLTSLIANNYLQLRSLDAQIAVSEDSLRTREESLQLTRRRLEGGISSALDVHQAEVSNSNLAAQIVELKRTRAVTLNQLAVLTGVLDLELPPADLATLPAPPTPPVGLPSTLLEARPDVRQAEENLVSMNANIGVAKAAMFPTISLTGSYGGESAALSDLFKPDARVWAAGVGLNLPIFNAGRLSARLDQATAQQKQALASYEASIQAAFREVNDALVSIRQNTERETLLDNSRISAKKALEISENRYRSGYSAYIDVLDSQRVYNDAALAYIQARQSRLVASVDMFKALGGGWKPEEPAE